MSPITDDEHDSAMPEGQGVPRHQLRCCVCVNADREEISRRPAAAYCERGSPIRIWGEPINIRVTSFGEYFS
jgi:hypothetical protein